MNASLWVGALVSLAGVALGGAVSFVLSRQQMRDAKAQRIEDDLRMNRRRSEDRRFASYSDFFTHARTYRDALRPLESKTISKVSLEEIDSLASSASNSSALVFMMVESEMTYEVCRAIVNSIKRIQVILHDPSSDQAVARRRAELIKNLARLLREFQVAVRQELGVTGIGPSVILARGIPTKNFSDTGDGTN